MHNERQASQGSSSAVTKPRITKIILRWLQPVNLPPLFVDPDDLCKLQKLKRELTGAQARLKHFSIQNPVPPHTDL
jgi:hypothetical protein